MNIPYVMKRCTCCGKWKVASIVNFNRQKGGKYGLHSKCKECRSKKAKQWRKNNKDKKREYDKQYHEANREKIREQKKQYYQSPQGQVAIFNGHHRRRIKEEQLGTGITKDQWLEMMSFFDWRCAYSGETLTKKTRSMDHIVPIDAGGNNMIWNCVPMTRSLNSSKNSSNMEEWYKGQSFYSEARLEKIYEWQEYAYNKWEKGIDYVNINDIDID